MSEASRTKVPRLLTAITEALEWCNKEYLEIMEWNEIYSMKKDEDSSDRKESLKALRNLKISLFQNIYKLISKMGLCSPLLKKVHHMKGSLKELVASARKKLCSFVRENGIRGASRAIASNLTNFERAKEAEVVEKARLFSYIRLEVYKYLRFRGGRDEKQL